MSEQIQRPPPPAAPSPPLSSTPPAAGKYDAIVDAWFIDQIHDSPVARATEAFNHLRAAVVDLKARLNKGK